MIKEKEAQKKQQIDPAFFDTQPKPFKLGRFLHNKKEGTYLGRTPNSWGKNNTEENILLTFFLLSNFQKQNGKCQQESK